MIDIKLLLAEDEKRMACALQELLRQEGYDVDCVSDGAAALSAIQNDLYDGIILDVMMPGMNGYQVASQARK